MVKNKYFEKTQTSNPHNLAINQHIIPRASIERFYNYNNQIELKNLSSRKKLQSFTNASDEIFIVKRLWSQKTEARIMKSIEDKFQGLVDKIIEQSLLTFSKEENETILDMYSLWEFRTHYIDEFMNIHTNTPLYEIAPPNITKDEEEILESKGACYVSQDKTVSERFILELEVRRFIDMKYSYRKNIKWGLLKSKDIEFIMPSNPVYKHNVNNIERMIFPITPNLCLIPMPYFETIDSSGVNELNQIMMKNSKWFYFGRKLLPL